MTCPKCNEREATVLWDGGASGRPCGLCRECAERVVDAINHDADRRSLFDRTLRAMSRRAQNVFLGLDPGAAEEWDDDVPEVR